MDKKAILEIFQIIIKVKLNLAIWIIINNQILMEVKVSFNLIIIVQINSKTITNHNQILEISCRAIINKYKIISKLMIKIISHQIYFLIIWFKTNCSFKNWKTF